MVTTLGPFEHGSPEWHEARRTRVGGSEIGAVCGWSPYETRDQVLARKAGGDTREPTRAMRRGAICEPAVLAHLCDTLGASIDAEATALTYVDGRRLFNPDGITTDGRLLEAKTTSDRSEDAGWGRARTDLVPLGYAAQAQWGMGLLGLDECWLGVLAGAHNGAPNLHFATYRLTFNPQIFRHMTRRADQFLDELDALTSERETLQ